MAVILIIDDDRSTRTILRYVLEKSGYDIIEASNGEVGYKLCSTKQIDLVITDVLMPQKDGIDTIIDLKFEFPDVKVIAISGDKIWLETLTVFNVVKTFTKPLDINELLKTVNGLFNNSNA